MYIRYMCVCVSVLGTLKWTMEQGFAKAPLHRVVPLSSRVAQNSIIQLCCFIKTRIGHWHAHKPQSKSLEDKVLKPKRSESGFLYTLL